MIVKRLEDLQLWQRALEFWELVDGVLDRPRFQREPELQDQLRRAADSILSNISEGFEQPTDRSFAKFLYYAKGSTAEARTRLLIASKRNIISTEEFTKRNDIGDEVARMATGLIKYLRSSDRRDRGLGRGEPAPRVRG